MTQTIAIAGATGAVGKELLRLLEDRAAPGARLRLFASERSAGRKMRFRGEDIPVEVLAEDVFEGCDYAFFSCGGERSKRFAPAAVESGCVVIDNSSAFRLTEGVPLVVPEVNAAALAQPAGAARGRLIANPNCSTILMVVALAPIQRAVGLERVIVATYQAASGAGQQAMDSLVAGTRAALDADASGQSFEDPSAEVFGQGLAFNLVPKIDRLLDDGRSGEELKMLAETRKILDLPALRVDATCIRVPILRCHAESVSVETSRPIGVEDARRVFASAQGLRLVDGPEVFPMPSSVAGDDAVEVGRIRESTVFENGLTFFLCGDQLLKGAALNAVQIYESLESSSAGQSGACANV